MVETVTTPQTEEDQDYVLTRDVQPLQQLCAGDFADIGVSVFHSLCIDWKSLRISGNDTLALCVCDSVLLDCVPDIQKLDPLLNLQIDPDSEIQYFQEECYWSPAIVEDIPVNPVAVNCSSDCYVSFDILTFGGEKLYTMAMLMADNFLLQRRHVQSLVFLKYVCLMAFCSSLFSGAAANELIITNQSLQPDCIDWFGVKRRDCPLKNTWPSEWAELNKSCCSGHPGTLLHCQQGYLDNDRGQYNFPACLAVVTAPEGQRAVLEKSQSGEPELVLKPCEPGTYQSVARNSSDIGYSYCTQVQSKCQGDGMEILCRGGTTQNNRCTCRQGYKPTGPDSCLAGFEEENVKCFCEVMTCAAGFHALHNLTERMQPLCSDWNGTVRFVCVPIFSTVSPGSGSDDNGSGTDVSGSSENPGTGRTGSPVLPQVPAHAPGKDGGGVFFKMFFEVLAIVAMLAFVVGIVIYGITTYRRARGEKVAGQESSASLVSVSST
ncbi:uncharacterized protein [Littorina saxatilis]|uniref:Uncharacterized protein n=1 Tax=Littorina saxatilis TaxID=31220 RepID=A0AAN9G5D5_9CAEN